MSFLLDYQKKVSDLQRRVADLGRRVSRKWREIPTVATNDCDVVITFSPSTRGTSVLWLVNLLTERIPQLVVGYNHHKASKKVALYLSVSCRGLLIGAEELKIKKPLIESGGGVQEFRVDDLDLFQGSDDLETFLTSSERCCVARHFLMSLRAREGDVWSESLEFTEGEVIVSKLQTAGIISQIYPIHQTEELNKLKESWVRRWTLHQPLDEIQAYFGVYVALYFAWLGHYTWSLFVPSILGFFVWLLVDLKGDTFCHLLLAIFWLGWSSVYLEHWKRTSTSLTYRWGTWDSPPSLLEEPRIAFKGQLTLCPITKRLVPSYPAWKRKLTYCLVTGPIILVSLFLVVLTTLWFVWLQEQVDLWVAAAGKARSLPQSDPGDDPSLSLSLVLLTHTPKVLLALVVYLMNFCYSKIASWLTDFENHRLEVDHHNHLVGKLLLLQFMNSFFSLFYTAFYLQDINMLQQQLTTLMITRQILGNVKEIFLPYGESRLRLALLSLKYAGHQWSSPPSGDSAPVAPESLGAGAGSPSVPQSGERDCRETEVRHRREEEVPSVVRARGRRVSIVHIVSAERESTLLAYDGPDEDFLEIFVQFCYVSMFSCVFPVAGLLALFNNLVEIRGDAFKLVSSYQRPFSQSACSIGIWQIAMEMAGYAAVIVNIGLLQVSGLVQSLFPQLSTPQLLLLLVLLEHACFFFRYMLSSLISEIPTTVHQQIAELEHRRREALRTLERDSMRQRRARSNSDSHGKVEEQKDDKVAGDVDLDCDANVLQSTAI